MIHQPSNSLGRNIDARLYKNGASCGNHFHRNFELIYSLTDNVKITSGKRKFVLSEGDMLLIPPSLPHSIDEPGKPVWIGVFSEDYVTVFAKKYKDKIYAPFRADIATDAFLKEKLILPETPEKLTLKACLYAVCAECERCAEVIGERPNVGLADEVLAYISSHFTENIRMEDAANALGYEYHYFSKLFHDLFDMNFKELVNIFRYERACELMEEGVKSITEIAFESGFQSVRNFNRVVERMRIRNSEL